MNSVCNIPGRLDRKISYDYDLRNSRLFVATFIMATLQPRIILGFPDVNNVGCKLLDKIRTTNENELEVANGKVRVRNVGDVCSRNFI